MQDGTVYIFLHTCKLNDAFVNRAFRDEAINSDLTGLAQTVCTIHGLCIVGRVPIVIIEHNSVSCSEVDAETSSTCTEKKDEDIRPIEVLAMDRNS